MFCNSCGKKITNNSKFCSSCGQPANVNAAVPSVPNPVSYNPQNNHSNNGSFEPDFEETLKKSFQIPWKHKALIFYGAILALFAGSGNWTNYKGDDFDFSNEASAAIGNISTLFQNDTFTGIVILGLILIVIPTILILANWAQAAIIAGVAKLEGGQKSITRKEIGKTGKRTVWNLIKLTFIIPVVFFLILAAVIFLGFLLFSNIPQPAGAAIGVTLLILLIFALIPFLVYFGLVLTMAARYIVIEKQGAFQSISSARGLMKGKFWWSFLYIIVTGIITGCGSCLGSIVLFIFGLITLGLLASGLTMVAIITGVFAVIGLAIFILVAGYFQAFSQTGLTLWWLELKKIKKS